MAADINFYKYLVAAFRYKLLNKNAASYGYLGFNFSYERVFHYARRLFPSYYRTNFLDTEEGNLQMAEEIIKKLDNKQDAELLKYFDPATAPDDSLVIAEAAKESVAQAQPAPPVTAPATAGPLPRPIIHPPSIPTISKGSKGEAQSEADKASGAVERTPEAEESSTEQGAKQTPSERPGDASGALQPDKPTTDTSQRFNLPGFRSSTSSVFKRVQNLTSPAGPFLKTNLSRIGRGAVGAVRTGLEAAAPPLGRAFHTGLNGIERIIKPGGTGGGGIGQGLSKSSKKFALGLIIGLLLFVFVGGLLGGIGETTPGETTPPTGGWTDISNCKFTRAGNPQLIKSSVLAGWISTAAISAGIPAPILASVAMHESQDFVANADNNHDAIKSGQYCNYGPWMCINKENTGTIYPDDGQDHPCTPTDIANGARTARAVGLMQNIDIYNPGKDLCSITENLNIAATKLKNDGVTSQPNQNQVNQAINAYYNSCTYGSYSYCNEVWQDLQNCQTSSGTIPPPADGNYQKWVQDFGISMNGFEPYVYQWAYEVLASTATIAPKFKDLIHNQCQTITLTPTSGISHAEGCDIPLSSGAGGKFFKYLLIHELAHKINTTSWQYNSQIIQARTDDASQDTQANNGFLTYYSEHAARAWDKICGDGDDNGNRADEEFADSVAYFINRSTEELNMHSTNDSMGACGIKWGENPFFGGGRYKAHYQLMSDILK